jgi:enamine deaminase RidA (YjgF/YER057c/UK114 family)
MTEVVFANDRLDPGQTGRGSHPAMNRLQTIDQGIATKIGYYADAIVIPAGYQQVLVSATPGIDQDGEVADDATGQSEQAWENVTRVLEAAGATVGDIVFTRLWLTGSPTSARASRCASGISPGGRRRRSRSSTRSNARSSSSRWRSSPPYRPTR